MTPRFILFLLILRIGLQAIAQGDLVSTRYLQLQEAYTQRMQEIEGRYLQAEREYLNQFILSLPRIEQYYRNEGHLEGVVACQTLQESILQNMEYPDPDQDLPEGLSAEVEELIEKRDQARDQNQQELDKLNRMLLNALEPYKVAFTKEGKLEQAMEVREIQIKLSETLDLNEENTPQDNPPPVVSTNPNAYPFSLEPKEYADIAGVAAREPAIQYEPKIDEKAGRNRRGFGFNDGELSIEPKAMTVLLEQAKRNQMLSIEFAIRPAGHSQWNAQAPALILLYGNNLKDANVAITQEGRGIYLYLRTTSPPKNRPLYRIWLHNADPTKPQHINLAYRSGELTIFVDGSETRKLRGDVTGLLSNWEEYPVKMGRLPAPPNIPDLPPTINWRGQVFNFYMRSTLESARDVSKNYNRFSTAITR
jgi:hypothetical protein